MRGRDSYLKINWGTEQYDEIYLWKAQKNDTT